MLMYLEEDLVQKSISLQKKYSLRVTVLARVSAGSLVAEENELI